MTDAGGRSPGGPAPERVHPTLDDPVVATLSEGVGGRLGSRAGRHRWWTPARVALAVAAVCFALGMLQKSTCYEATWGNGETRYTHMCYSDLPYLYTGRGFAELAWPYSDDRELRARYDVMEYPVVISYYAWGTAWVTHWWNGSPDLTSRYSQRAAALFESPTVLREVRYFVIVSALGFAAATLLSAWLLTRVNPRRPWDAVLFAAAPVLALNALVNWDTLVVAMVAGALWAWARERPGLTGVMIGVGTATKLFPLLLLGAVLVVCLRRRRLRDFWLVTATALWSWVLVNLPAYLTGSDEWRVFWQFNSDRGADLGSIWLVVAQALDTPVEAATINHASWLFLGVWCLGVLLVGVRAPATPRLAQLAFLVVAGFLLVNKVYSPQYVLWLLPLAVMARPRWRDQLVWQAGEVLYFASVWWYLGEHLGAPGTDDAGFYWLAIVLRMAAELYLVGLVVRDVLRPGHDPVDREPAAWPRRNQPSTTRSNQVAV